MIFHLALYAIAALAVVGVGLYAAGAYNQTVAARLEVSRAFANTEVSLKQRHDEIPRLVEICRAYARHEKETLESVVAARLLYDAAEDVDGKVPAANRIGRELVRVLALAEAYPKLAADAHFKRLATRLTSLENEIADRRELFNAAVTAYNSWIETFPVLLFARPLGFHRAPLLVLGVEPA